jgi:LEA14-like dessication related protein
MHLRHRSLSALLLAVVALSAAACAGPRSPQVTVEGIRIGGLGLRGGTLFAQVHVTNPNSFDLETRSVTYDLQVPHPTESGQWVSFAQGTIEERIRIDRRAAKTLELPVHFRYDDMGGAMLRILDTGTFDYRVVGDVRLAEPIGRSFPFQRTGTVSMDGIRD